MSFSSAEFSPRESAGARRVLLHVATARDAEISTRLLIAAGLHTVACASVRELIAEIRAGAAAVLATDEILSRPDTPDLLQLLATQPEWSDLPFVLLLRGGTHSARTTEVLDRLTNATILERPAGMRSVLSAVQAAVRARQRQYRARTLIEALRDAEARARDAHRAKDDFLAALSHELRTPLTPVLLAASEAARDPNVPAESREVFDTIAQNVSLEARLIDDLLDLTHITRGKLPMQETRLDGLRVLRDAIRNVRPDYEAKRVVLRTELPAQPAPVVGDAARLQQVFWNVLRNAAKFTPAGGEVCVRARVAGSRLEVTVEDSGIGMEPHELATVFDAFAQGDHASKSSGHKFGGLGLGLAISRTLVERHGGEITASSAGRGRGSSFRITIPLQAEPAAEEPGKDRDRPAAPAPLRILLVEDDLASREALVRILRTRGHAVSAAGSVAEAEAVAAQSGFDVLLSDIGLPDDTGYALPTRLGPAAPPVAIALTGYGAEEDIEEAHRSGFRFHVTKPLRAADLERVLADATTDLRRLRRIEVPPAAPSPAG